MAKRFEFTATGGRYVLALGAGFFGPEGDTQAVRVSDQLKGRGATAAEAVEMARANRPEGWEHARLVFAVYDCPADSDRNPWQDEAPGLKLVGIVDGECWAIGCPVRFPVRGAR